MVDDHFALKRARIHSNLHLDAINMAFTKTTELVFNLLPAGTDVVDREGSLMFPRGGIGTRRILSGL